MRKLLLIALLFTLALNIHAKGFVGIDGKNLIAPDGTTFLIKGTNLGNWLNPEGYMFSFKTTSSARQINEMFCELVGPDATADFWKAFKDNYITEDDIRFIKQTGSNTIRLPFNYRLFTDEDYMGLSASQDGMERLESVVNWCRKYGLYLILDMHDAPGGQTGDNIDDSYGYPWIFESEISQQRFCSIWKEIAAHFKDEPVVLGYELMNEPIPNYMPNKVQLGAKLEPLYKKVVSVIRQVDKNHIILLGGYEWNGNFSQFTDWKFDDKLMYTCHRYGGEPTANALRAIIDFRDKTGLPMYMGETGHNSYEWMGRMRETLESNGIGWTYWPYKKMEESCFVGVTPPEDWQTIVGFAEAPRTTFAEIQKARPDQAKSRAILNKYIEACKFMNGVVQKKYLECLGLSAQQ